jgi:YD repeat-containing protein
MNAPDQLKKYDRTTQTVGNIVLLEHFNCLINDQRLATLFYIVGLGGTRDPYIFMGLENMWVNFGRTQVHLPSRGPAPRPEVLRGTAGFVVPDLGALKKNLEFAGKEMKRVAPEKTTRFDWQDRGDTVEATCPWGNRVRCHAPSAEYPRTDLGLVYVDFDVPSGTAEGIARFYSQVMKAPAKAANGRAVVSVGRNQKLLFSETKEKLPEYDGHHVQIYIADFSNPYAWLKDRGLINMETDQHEWRFQWIADPQDNRKLFQIEHEVRSMTHPLFGRPLVNRNPDVTNRAYVPGEDAFRGTY